MIYMWCSCRSVHNYIGMTTNGYEIRSKQHYRVMCDITLYTKNGWTVLPFYKFANFTGTSCWFPIPLFSITSSTEVEMKMVESQIIQRWKPHMNTPWVHRHVQGKTCSEFVTGVELNKFTKPSPSHWVKQEFKNMSKINKDGLSWMMVVNMLPPRATSVTSKG